PERRPREGDIEGRRKRLRNQSVFMVEFLEIGESWAPRPWCSAHRGRRRRDHVGVLLTGSGLAVKGRQQCRKPAAGRGWMSDEIVHGPPSREICPNGGTTGQFFCPGLHRRGAARAFKRLLA